MDFNHSPMHMPVIPRSEFKGRTGNGDWADALLELDADFGTLLDLLGERALQREPPIPLVLLSSMFRSLQPDSPYGVVTGQ